MKHGVWLFAWVALTPLACHSALGPANAGRAQPAARVPPIVETQPLHVGELGRIDAALLNRISNTRYIDHLKVGLGADGGLRQLSIYHNDPNPIPAVVRQVLHDRFPRHHILNYETEWEREDGAVTEVAIRLPDQRLCELSCLDDGTVRFTECIIEPSSLPPEVVAAVHRTVPEASIVEAQMRTDETGDHFKVQARQGQQLHALMLSPQGELASHRLKIPAVILVEYQ